MVARGLAKDALGLGLRRPHYSRLSEAWPALDYFEIISESFVSASAPSYELLDRLAERYPIVLHGVSLNLLGPEPPSRAYLDAVSALAERVSAPFVSDHLCWTGAHGHAHHDLLPTPYVAELLELAAERAAYVQAYLGRPFGLENLSSYVEFGESTLSEWDFYAGVVQRAGCGFLLDLNNVYVSSQNHGFSPQQYLSALDFSRVLQVHLAGHTREPGGTLVDTHDAPVSDAVWQLYRETYRAHGPFPTLLEWDDRIPPLSDVLAELDKAKVHRA